MEIVGRSSTLSVPKSMGRYPTPARKKFRWRDPDTGISFSAGGILFYDNEGFWTIAEAISTRTRDVEYTDPGGRYAFEDGNIYATIARELREETYGVCEILASEIKDLAKRYPPTLVCGGGPSDTRPPAYMCLVVNVDELRTLPGIGSRFSLDPDRYALARARTIAENPDTPSAFYTPTALKKIPFGAAVFHNLSYRLRSVLRSNKTLPNTSIPSPPPPSPSPTHDS